MYIPVKESAMKYFYKFVGVQVVWEIGNYWYRLVVGNGILSQRSNRRFEGDDFRLNYVKLIRLVFLYSHFCTLSVKQYSNSP